MIKKLANVSIHTLLVLLITYVSRTIDGCISLNHAVLNAVNKYKNHPSIFRIKKSITCRETFIFQPVSSLDFRNEIHQRNRSKETSGKLSTDIVKSIADNCLGVE